VPAAVARPGRRPVGQLRVHGGVIRPPSPARDAGPPWARPVRVAERAGRGRCC
jgi:hypothetical protein